MSFSWSELNDRRTAVRRRWGKIRRLPVIARSMRYVAGRISPGDRVIDVGASGGAFREKLPNGVVYRALDPDPNVRPDFRGFDEVSESFDVAVCFETIEHLPLNEAQRLVSGLFGVLEPGGRLFLTTPNVHHPWAFRSSATHLTPFPYDELGGLLEQNGFVVEAFFRCHHDAFLKGVARFLCRPIYRIAGIDYARSILVVARRPAD